MYRKMLLDLSVELFGGGGGGQNSWNLQKFYLEIFRVPLWRGLSSIFVRSKHCTRLICRTFQEVNRTLNRMPGIKKKITFKFSGDI